MSLQKENKRLIIYHLKENGYYSHIRNKYNNNILYNNLFDALLNTLYPKLLIDLFMFDLDMSYFEWNEISRKLKEVGYFPNEFKNVVNKAFNVETKKEKYLFKCFLKKYGIIPYDKDINHLERYNQFYISYSNTVSEVNMTRKDTISLCKIIYEYEKIADKLNGVKRNWFYNLIKFLKLKFTLTL